MRDSCALVMRMDAEPPGRFTFVGHGLPAMLETTTPVSADADTAAVPAPSVRALRQVPFGAAPAATVWFWPAAVKLKLVPAVTPVPPTLQITRVPVGPRLVNV